MNEKKPADFVYLNEFDPTIITAPIYYSNDNFIGRRIKGYEKPVVILTTDAAKALSEVQKELNKQGLGLKVIDGYRPQQACDDFWDWANDPTDLKMKDLYYPRIDDKKDLFNGYVARFSRHSRGSTVDLTIVDSNGNDLDMGSRIDMLDPISQVISDEISQNAQKNRLLLKEIMEKHGFEGYEKEWWHFSLINEPYKRKPEDHFNFEVK